MASSVIISDQIEVPLEINSLAKFRRWATSKTFPDQGRIDYVANHIEVDMSPENLFSHGSLKVEIARVFANRVKRNDSGHVFSDFLVIGNRQCSWMTFAHQDHVAAALTNLQPSERSNALTTWRPLMRGNWAIRR